MNPEPETLNIKTRNPTPVIVCGHQRSGTTLLYLLLQSHRQIELTREYNNFAWVNAPCRHYLNKLEKRHTHRMVIGAGTPRHPRIARWRDARFKTRYVRAVHRYARPFVTIDVIAQSMGKALRAADVVGDKYPDYVFKLDKFCAIDALKCIVIYRDVRDVARSTLEKCRAEWRNRPFAEKMDSPEKVADRWAESVRTMRAHEDRLLAVKYEQLVQEPAATLARIGEYLGVAPNGFKADIAQPDRIGKYKDELTVKQVDQLLYVAGDEMQALGYA